MVKDNFRIILTKRISLHPEDYINIEKCWEEETKILTSDMAQTIDFIINECTDDEFAWMSEIFEDIAHESPSVDFVNALKERANIMTAGEDKDSVLREIKYVKDIVEEILAENQ